MNCLTFNKVIFFIIIKDMHKSLLKTLIYKKNNIFFKRGRMIHKIKLRIDFRKLNIKVNFLVKYLNLRE